IFTVSVLSAGGATVGFWAAILFAMEAHETPSFESRALTSLFASLGLVLGILCSAAFVLNTLIG
ncbi:MAG TPA: hypothetical protein VJ227_04425, partial [Patescibacteria group bacterium]|nr:hypothetical protein [Patescibacteria group bacterium]